MAKRRPRSRYTPTYDYSKANEWSMTKEESNAILDAATDCMERGDIEGYDRIIRKLPLVPNIALMKLDDMGKEKLLASGYNLKDADIVYGEGWMDRMRKSNEG